MKENTERRLNELIHSPQSSTPEYTPRNLRRLIVSVVVTLGLALCCYSLTVPAVDRLNDVLNNQWGLSYDGHGLYLERAGPCIIYGIYQGAGQPYTGTLVFDIPGFETAPQHYTGMRPCS